VKDERRQHEAEQELREEQEANRRKEEQERFDRLLDTLQPGQQQPPQQQQAGGGGGVARQAAAQGHTAGPTAKAPPTLNKNMDFKKFVQWTKSWTNYTTVIMLPDQTREQHIATFRSFCSPELLDKMIHAMKIAEDTAQMLEQILTTVEI
jgi:hypothetical protein